MNIEPLKSSLLINDSFCKHRGIAKDSVHSPHIKGHNERTKDDRKQL
jgi:hypothetical protein